MAMEDTFAGVTGFYMHVLNKRGIHYLLARMTHHIERESGMPTQFDQYVRRDMTKPYEVEHIWANHPEIYTDEFANENEFNMYRNRFGDLLLLPRGTNQSFSDAPYTSKLDFYYGENLLAKSLHTKAYQKNPNFLNYVQRSSLPFKPHAVYKKEDLDTRQDLYRRLCEEIWSPSRFLAEMNA